MASASTLNMANGPPTEPSPATTAPTVRKFKASDLPLTTATRTAIEGLAHSFKKQGGYDAIRKQVWDKFEASDYENQVTKSILGVAEKELDRNPSQLLTLDRRKAAALIDGALDRSGVYQQAEEVIDQLIDVKAIEARIRELRKADIGEKAALAEEERGSKTDLDYAQESGVRLQERENIRRILREKEEQIEEEKRKIEREERKHREREAEKAEAKRQEERDARRREREAKEADRELQRQKERDERRAAREKEREEREKEREARRRSRDQRREKRSRSRSRDRSRRRERDRNHDRSRSRRRDSRERRRRDRSREGRERHRPEEVKKSLSKEELERLERDALADLLRESKRNAEPQPEIEIDEALAPPPKKTKPASAIQPIRRDSPKTASDGKKAAPLIKTESKDSATDSKEPKETKDSKDISTSTKEVQDSKTSKDSDVGKEGSRVPKAETETETGTGSATVRLNAHETVNVIVTRIGIAIVRESAVIHARWKEGKEVDPDAESAAVLPPVGLLMRTTTGREKRGPEIAVPLDVGMIGTDEFEAVQGIERSGVEADVVSVADRVFATIATGVTERIAAKDRVRLASVDRSRSTRRARSKEPKELEKAGDRTEKTRDRRSRSRSRPTTASKQDVVEVWKVGEIKKREQEAKAYLAAQLPASDLPKPSAQGLKLAMILTATVLVKIDEEIAKTSATLTVTEIASETENGTERETVIVIGPGIVARETTIPEMTVATRTRIATEMTDAIDVVAEAGAGADAANVIGAETAIGEIVTGTETGTVEPDESAALMIGATDESAVAVDQEGEAEVRVSNAGTLQL
ncbi:complex proteins associated with Set1p component shg1-domain-containing protein [Pestalotiopsis sp. NC0098]|nr:complex proteins associated with Set1p component shg1-domain-containing protein [Pestalotiopsis sp. NC0098]